MVKIFFQNVALYDASTGNFISQAGQPATFDNVDDDLLFTLGDAQDFLTIPNSPIQDFPYVGQGTVELSNGTTVSVPVFQGVVEGLTVNLVGFPTAPGGNLNGSTFQQIDTTDPFDFSAISGQKVFEVSSYAVIDQDAGQIFQVVDAPAASAAFETDGVFNVGQTVDFGTGSFEYVGIANVDGTAYPVFEINDTTTAIFLDDTGDASDNIGEVTGFTVADFNLDGSTPAPDIPPALFIEYVANADGSRVGDVTNFADPLALITDDGDLAPGDIISFAQMEFEYRGTTELGGVTGYVFDDASDAIVIFFESDPGDIGGDVIILSLETVPVCFVEGTQITTPEGPVAVQDLQRGDMVLTQKGRPVAVTWVGRQTVSNRFGMAERLRPVRVRAGALCERLPVRDLTLTADHALLVDGLLINAGALVNGTTIDYVPLSELGDSYTVYHIETENHDVILAEGAPAETYIDYAARRAFDNYDEYVALYGEERVITEMPYPRISSARQLPTALKQRLRTIQAA